MHPFVALQPRPAPTCALAPAGGRGGQPPETSQTPAHQSLRSRLRRPISPRPLAKVPTTTHLSTISSTRRLRPDTRSIAEAPGQIVSPADGTVSQAGVIRNGSLLQAKGHEYAVADLLGNTDFAHSFTDGSFATIYLAPYNYHRVHAPCDARLAATLEVPGRLFSVNSVTERHVHGLFARNERLVLHLDTDFGACALVLVGAMIVGRIAVAWPDGPDFSLSAATTANAVGRCLRAWRRSRGLHAWFHGGGAVSSWHGGTCASRTGPAHPSRWASPLGRER